jgi:hypothetical protein
MIGSEFMEKRKFHEKGIDTGIGDYARFLRVVR